MFSIVKLFQTASRHQQLAQANSDPGAIFAKAIAELNAYSDAELADLDLVRGEIEHAVRHGRSGIDVGGRLVA